MIVVPSPYDRVEVLNDFLQARSVSSADDLFDPFLDTLVGAVGRPEAGDVGHLRFYRFGRGAPHVDAEKVEALVGADDPGLLRVQFQTEACEHGSYPLEHSLTVAVEQDDEVIRVSDQGTGDAGLLEHLVEAVQIDVRQQGRDDSALGSSGTGADVPALFHDPGFEPAADEFEHPRVAHALLNLPQENVVPNGIEVAFDIGVDDDGLSAEGDLGADLLDRLVSIATRAKAKGAIQKVGFEDRLENQLGRHLHDPVLDDRYPQRALLGLARLVDPTSSYGLRAIAFVSEFFADLREKLFDSDDLLNVLDALPVDSGGAAIDPDLFPGRPQYVLSIKLVVEGAESPIQRLFRCTGELVLQEADFYSHVPSRWHSCIFSCRQARSKQGRTLGQSCVVSAVITSRPLRHPSARHPPLAGFIRLEGACRRRSCGGGGRTSGPSFRLLSPHADGLTPGPLQVRVPFCFPADTGLPQNRSGSACIPISRVYPAPGLSQQSPSELT